MVNVLVANSQCSVQEMIGRHHSRLFLGDGIVQLRTRYHSRPSCQISPNSRFRATSAYASETTEFLKEVSEDASRSHTLNSARMRNSVFTGLN
jgi:hypothetical protein